MTWPVVTSVSHATRTFHGELPALSSAAKIASTIESEIWSATLSGWPIETDSEVNRCVERRNCELTRVPFVRLTFARERTRRRPPRHPRYDRAGGRPGGGESRIYDATGVDARTPTLLSLFLG